MARIEAELERLDQAVRRLEGTVDERDARLAQEMEAARRRTAAETEHVAAKVDEAIARLETVLDR